MLIAVAVQLYVMLGLQPIIISNYTFLHCITARIEHCFQVTLQFMEDEHRKRTRGGAVVGVYV